MAIVVVLMVPAACSAQVVPVDQISLIGGFHDAKPYQGEWYILDQSGSHLLKSSSEGELDSAVVNLPRWSRQLLIHGNLAIVRIEKHNVQIYDLSEPWPPPLLSQLHFQDEVRYISAYDTLLAVTLETEGYRFYCLSDPYDIDPAGSIPWLDPDEGETYAYRSMVWNGEYMVAGRTTRYYNQFEGWMDLQDQILCFQIGENGELTFLDSLHTGNERAQLSENRLIVWDQTVYEIETQESITEIMSIDWHYNQMAFTDSHLYVTTAISASDQRVLQCYSFEAGEPIVLQQEVDLQSDLKIALSVNDSSIFCGGLLSALTIGRDPDSGQIETPLGSLQGGQTSVNISVSGNRFASVSDDGSLSTGLFDDDGFTELHYHQADSIREPVQLRDSLLITDLPGPGLGWWTVTEYSIEFIRRFGTTALDVKLSDQMVWTLDFEGAIHAFSRVDGSLVTSIESDDVTFISFDLIGDFLYCLYSGFNGNGILRWNVENPNQPVELPGLSYSGTVGEVKVLEGGVHFIVRSERSVSINRIGPDGTAWEMWLCYFPGSYLTDMEVLQNRLLAFFASGGSETVGGRVYLYDFQTITDPTLIDHFPLTHDASSLSSFGQFLMTAEGGQIRLFDLSAALDLPETETEIPRAFKILAPYPNPFNALVTIPFYIPKSGEVRVRVYNLLGQEVWGRQLGALAPGWHRTVWDADGSGVSSGVYILHLEADGEREVRRVTLMR